MKKIIQVRFICFLSCKGLSYDDVGVASRGTVRSGDTAGSWFQLKTGDFVQEPLGGLLPKNDSLEASYVTLSGTTVV